jgi:hypothetical protein
MRILSRIAQAMQSVLGSFADHAARFTGFQLRKGKLGGQGFVQTLVLGCLENPRPTLEQLAQTAAAGGFPVSPQALDQKFTSEAVDTLEMVLQHALEQVIVADPVEAPLLQRFPGGVFIQDSTFVVLPDQLQDRWPGHGGGANSLNPPRNPFPKTHAALKFQVRLNLSNGQLFGPFPNPSRLSDSRSLFRDAPLPEGSLRIADLGYFDVAEFRRLGRNGCYWLSRWLWNTALYRVQDDQQQRWDPHAFLSRLPGDQTAVDLEVLLGADYRIPCRLVAWRVPATEAEQRRRKLREKALKEGNQPTTVQLELCDWSIFLTNVPNELANPAEISVLARSRWQIELLFKQWKSDLKAGSSRSEQPYRVACELLAAMIAAVIQHWIVAASCWRKALRSLRKAGNAVRSMARTLAGSLGERERLEWALEQIERSLQAAAKINRSRKKPRTWQLWLEPTLFGESASTS